MPQKVGELSMVDRILRWGNGALMVTLLLITYAVFVTLR
jgi:hypothetical protein